jgi:hypothetical protein
LTKRAADVKLTGNESSDVEVTGVSEGTVTHLVTVEDEGHEARYEQK